MQLNEFFVSGNVDVEKPMHHSEPHSIHLYTKIATKRIMFDIPIHLRYQRANIGRDFGKVTITLPVISLSCNKTEKVLCGVREMGLDVNNRRSSLQYGDFVTISYKSVSRARRA